MARKRKSRSGGDRPVVRREVRELSLLIELSQTLDRSMDLRDVLGPALEAIARHMGMIYGTVTLLNRETGEISIETAYGLSDGQRRRGRYKLGEGVTGTVVASGEPVVIPRVSEDTRFLDRTGDEIPTSMRAGAMPPKGAMTQEAWINASEECTVAIGLRYRF